MTSVTLGFLGFGRGSPYLPPTATAVNEARRRVHLQRRQGRARRLRPQLPEDRAEGLDASRQEITISVDRIAQQPDQRIGFAVRRATAPMPANSSRSSIRCSATSKPGWSVPTMGSAPSISRATCGSGPTGSIAATCQTVRIAI
jgi:hypothetical protein